MFELVKKLNKSPLPNLSHQTNVMSFEDIDDDGDEGFTIILPSLMKIY